MISVIATFLGDAGVVAIVLLTFLYFGRRGIAEWLTREIRHSYDVDLERTKAEFRQSVDAALHVQAAVVGAAAASQSAAFSHRVDSIRRLWRALVEIRDKAPVAVGMTEYLTTDEVVEQLDKQPRMAAQVRPGSEQMMICCGPEIEELRLLAGEYLWSLFVTYRALTARVGAYFLFRTERGRVKVPPTWKEDRVVQQILSAVLTDSERQRFQQGEIGGLHFARGVIESKFIEAAAKVMSGEASASEMSETARRILETVSNAERT